MLKSPFPYFGGKSRLAPVVWEKFGIVDRYIEPFFGSGAVLLANPNPAKMEVVCDTNGFICNFYRAVKADPEQTAHYADYPTIHQDLTARHKWLMQWHAENGKQIEDPDFYDCKVAGWWVWGMSLWIGGEFCQIRRERRPNILPSGHGAGISKQVHIDKRPEIKDSGGGRGVSKQRVIHDQRPHISDFSSGQGVSKQSRITDGRPKVNNKSSSSHALANEHYDGILNWFTALSKRFERVIVLNRSWESAITPTVLADTDSCRNITRGIFLDPPYLTDQRKDSLYQSDRDGTSDDVAIASYEWAVENGNKDGYRIAYCAHEGDFPLPEGWTCETRSFSGIRKQERRDRQDIIMFSPGCKSDPQTELNL